MPNRRAVILRARQLARFIGLGADQTSHAEKLLAVGGALLSMLAVIAIGRHYAGDQGAAWLVASMGASAVLLFAVPHGPLSQPWPVIAGNVVSALIGVACARWISQPLLASAVAVSLAIGAMHYLRCIHPPGGATALTAVTGGEAVRALGFAYAITPVLLNALTMVLIAVAFNYLFAWRRYPASLAVRKPAPRASASPAQTAAKTNPVSEDESDHELAAPPLDCAAFRPGQYYSNGRHGPLWQIRQITAMPAKDCASGRIITYKIVAGHPRRATGEAELEEFARWARYEVFRNENSWQLISWGSQMDQQT